MTTLRPDDRISHYRIQGHLGAGGMGEVYAALDETLERSVALKILPPRLVRSEERVRRFITEARSASSLNHPNIVTIYEIGQGRMRPGKTPQGSPRQEQAEPMPMPLHFISMELVEGVTLTQKIHDEREDLRALVGYISQAAEGVSRAHAAGIVHRDLKPGNIMVSQDGLVKVLDFGLAKLIERQPASAEATTNLPTEEVNTREGAVVGTVGYMSPEQVLGKPADPRSDIFAMGCILYEAATQRRPFVADTDVEVMHQILRERPVPVEEINAAVPGELRRLIRRCLSKQPGERIQSMKDLAVDLREVAESWDSLQTSAGASGTLPRPATIPATPGRRRGMILGLAGVAFVVALAAMTLWLRGARPGAPAAPGGTMSLSLLMSRSDLLAAVLSGDARYLAWVESIGELSSLHVRQVRTGSEVQVLPPQEFPINGLSFSPDGDYLYYLNRDPDLPNYQALYQVASLGGAPRRIAFDVDTAVSFAPGGRELCFERGIPSETSGALVILDPATGRERELFRVHAPESFGSPGSPGASAWSPDGKRIAVPVFSVRERARTQVVTLDVVTGKRVDLGGNDWLFVESLAWLPDGSGLILSARVLGAGTDAIQLYRLSYPGGEARRLTNDLNGFRNVSISADGKSLTAVRQTRVANVWTVSAEGGEEARPLTFVSGSAAAIDRLVPLPDGVAFTNAQGDRSLLWRIDADGSRLRTLNADGHVERVTFAEKAGIVFTRAGNDALLHIWRVGADGSGLRQITNGPGEGLMDLSPDGTRFLFLRSDNRTRVLSMDPEGGEPREVLDLSLGDAVIYSPDGRRLLATSLEATAGGFYPRRVVMPAEGGDPLGTFQLPPGAVDLKWAPDGEGVTYIDGGTGFNLMRRPIASQAARQLTRFKEGRLRRHRWSLDGRKVLLLRSNGREESLWVLDPATAAAPMKLVEFKTGRIFDIAWARDSRRVYFLYGELGQDVVLLREPA